MTARFEWHVEGLTHRLFRGPELLGAVRADQRGLSWSLERSFTGGVQHFGACASYAEGRQRVEDAAADVIKSGTATSYIVRMEEAP